jgi:hypothetical protein
VVILTGCVATHPAAIDGQESAGHIRSGGGSLCALPDGLMTVCSSTIQNYVPENVKIHSPATCNKNLHLSTIAATGQVFISFFT